MDNYSPPSKRLKVETGITNAGCNEDGNKHFINILLSLRENGILQELIPVLTICKDNGIELHHIESRRAKENGSNFDILVRCHVDQRNQTTFIDKLKNTSKNFKIIPEQNADMTNEDVPWFPRNIRQLDIVANQVLSAGAELESDHPGFTDQVYRRRRKVFADIANEYKQNCGIKYHNTADGSFCRNALRVTRVIDAPVYGLLTKNSTGSGYRIKASNSAHMHTRNRLDLAVGGQPIPRVTYTPEEINTWRTIYTKLTELYPTHACKEYNDAFPKLQENCGFRPDNIPQLEDISNFLKDKTGFRLRPVAGLLSSRDFLAGLAFRVFHSTQYIRHGSKPMYTPEPDVCHELLGHVPLFADPTFAEFSQEIGLASLGAPDDYVKKLATCYWFTIEFGLCKQGNEVKAYGAGLLSSFGELQYCLTDEPEKKTFEPSVTGEQDYPITKYQPIYFVADSFRHAKDKMREYAKTIPKPFNIRYNPYTESVEVINDTKQVTDLTKAIKGDISLLEDTLKRIGENATHV